MTNDFPAVCAALWASLGLPRPPAAGRSATLTVDDRVVTLAPTPDERQILVSAACGTLSSDPSAMPEQLRRLLKNNLGLLVTNAACLALDERDAEGRSLVARALCPCRVDAVPKITKTIEDVLQMIDIQSTVVDDRSKGREPPANALSFASDESLIFRL